MEENTSSFNATNNATKFILTILLILSTLFSTGFYVLNRIGEVEKKVEVECELRKRIETQIDAINTKLDLIMQRLPERAK